MLSAKAWCTQGQTNNLGVPFMAAVSVSGMPKRVQILGERATVCADEFAGGFSIVCEPGFWAAFCKFSIDWNYIRTEYELPFYIYGNTRQHIVPWDDYPERGNMRCSFDDGTSLSSLVTFRC